MAEKHTPDWTLCDRGDYVDFDGDSRVILGDGMSVRIGVIQTNGRPETEANAYLAVAAPRLLKELQHLVALLEPLERDGTLNVPGHATLNGARAAIALATGDAQ